MDRILEQFLGEARDNLSYLDQHLPELKNSNEETINALFRAAHTLKGGAGLVGFTSVQEITHKAEDLLDAYRKHQIEYSDEMLDALYDAIDETVELIDAAEEQGSVDVDADLEKIEQIKNNIIKFLSSKEDEQKQKEEETVNTLLNISPIYVGELVNFEKISDIDIPIRIPKITNNFLEENNYWLMDMDLDEDTVKLGNDPYYILYMLGEDNIVNVTSVVNCKELQEDPYLWKTRIVAVVNSNRETLEDALYNVIDDVAITPLSIESLFKTSYEFSGSEVYKDFVKEFIAMVENKEFGKVAEKLSTIIEVVSRESKEGYTLNLLRLLLDKYDESDKRYYDILNLAMNELGIEANIKEEIKKEEPFDMDFDIEESEKDEEQKKAPEIPKNQLNAAKNILQSQIKALSFAKDDDESFIKRTKLVLNNVSRSLFIDCKVLNDANTKEQVRDVIEKIMDKIKIMEGQLNFDEKLEIEPEKSKEEIKENKIEEQVVDNEQDRQVVKKQKEETVGHKKAEVAHITKTVKIDQSVIDELMDIVGELLVMKNALPYIANNVGVISPEQSRRELLNKYEEISRLTDRFQDRVMGMRLLPLSYIFGRYPKLVRDLSKKLDKKIKYIEEGGETKIDKMMIEKLADPLVHVIRNSIDHGIETKEERIAKGKSEEGILKVVAHSKGDRVFIQISDDGAGIDTKKLIRKVIDNDMVSIEELDKMSEKEKLSLIFLPGLSTKDEVSELSGRGVGGDAVKKVVDELGGKIYVESVIDRGTTITLELPVSVALTNVFHIKMNNVNYAISMEYLVETAKIEKKDIKTANHKPFIRIRGEIIPLIFEELLLGKGYADKDEYNVLVIQGNSTKYGFVVDEFVGRLDVVQKPLEGVLGEHPFINGTSLLGNGEVIFILDPSKLVKN